jgi:hypothetical protein
MLLTWSEVSGLLAGMVGWAFLMLPVQSEISQVLCHLK